jgi:hypothetical protein
MSLIFGYKLSKDPGHNTAGRGKAFYSYATCGHGIECFKVECCSSDAKNRLEQIRILRYVHGVAQASLLATVQQQTEKAPIANSNFCIMAFVESCKRADLFDFIAEEGATL